ncbi:MAG: hypothetical protein B7Y15_09280 [Bacteroidetes bacterium 24-39-8]|jgi:hypothetical protein|nr:MAG: hypothetical protein B7Y15_09280 [Bacteroidetes bacterium 24-39-8]OZA67856.1 MAG: hypothetical protein B7X72_02890 [Sphingobacteriia bacterium 39-39-8]HQR92596.1 BatA domain-containing protein [Sediminibacterium sp.]HQS54508.1 BatA domain-containing protein [Sediminibacterium sp.]
MQFLNPIWLWSALGVVIPIAIHLWNQQPGNILEVGSIQFMDPSPSKRSSRLQLTEIWLLLLRCLIILLIALFLSKPIWNSTTQNGTKGWVLLPRASAQTAYQTHQFQIDSLLKMGMELHALESGFPLMDLPTTASLAANDTSQNETDPNYWKLAIQLEQQAPSNHQLHLFTPALLRYYQGNKPSFNRKINWHTYPLVLKLDTAKAVAKQPIRIALYTDQYQQDLSYVVAAFKAIQELKGNSFSWTIVSDPAKIPAADWLFWLSETPAPKGKFAHIVSYQIGSVKPIQSHLYQQNWSGFEPIALYKMVPMPTSGISIWEDGFGQPVLQKLPSGAYLLNTHFHPDWNGMVWSPYFPQIIKSVLEGQKLFDPENLPIDPQQILPESTNETTSTTALKRSSQNKTSSVWIWSTLLLLLIIERILVFYSSKNKARV